MILHPEIATNITNHLVKFRDFMVAAWPSLDSIMDQHDWEDDGGFTLDWVQVNWEFLVERELLGDSQYALAALSCHSKDDRISNPIKLPSHVVLAYAKEQNVSLLDYWDMSRVPFEAELRLAGFITTLKPRGLGYYPPFDFAELKYDSRKKTYHVPLTELSFILAPLTPPTLQEASVEYLSYIDEEIIPIIDPEEPTDITEHINKFRDFLITSWPHLESIMEDHDWEKDPDFIPEWQQANWEFFVERELLGKTEYALVPFSPLSRAKRISNVTKQPTHVVLAYPKTKNSLIPEGLRLAHFEPTHSFDYAKLISNSSNKPYTITIDELRFVLTPLSY